jgi:tetratricopeptide (TPR) repeat protein
MRVCDTIGMKDVKSTDAAHRAGVTRARHRRGAAGSRPRRAARPSRLLVGLCVGCALSVAGCGDAESALTRGDRFWAEQDYSAALAEYRLALRHRDEDQVLARVAHSYARLGQLERAREYYERLLGRNPNYTDQAIFDYVQLARHAQGRGDRHGMAGATEAALALRPGLPLDDMAAPLARYYAAMGDADRALDYFERALSRAPPDSVPPLLFELAETHIARSNCDEALGYLTAFRARAPRHPRSDEARWHVGNCSFELGRQARQEGRHEAALDYLRATIELAAPRHLLDQAWFERGEALAGLGRTSEAIGAFLMVLELNPGRGGQLVQRARQRIDELRFAPAWQP